MEVISIQDKERWNQIVKSFPNWDIYYLNEYALSLQLHGDGIPYLIYHQTKDAKLCYVVMQEDVADFPKLAPYIKHKQFFDWVTPYGYGGPLISGSISENWLGNFQKELLQWCTRHGIISQFIRFHPLLQNQKLVGCICDVVYLKKTVYISTKDKETIFQNMTPNNRNMVRKAEKNGIKICMDQGEHVQEFKLIYEETMRKNKADNYYYFEKEYFDYLIRDLKENIIFFYAFYENRPVSAAIFLYNGQFMHYHLSGTMPEFKKLASMNLLLSKAAEWAAEQGIPKFHLGGGVQENDSLLSFKKHFNRNGLIDFCIGRTIFDKASFDKLTKLRKQYDGQYDENRPFLIKYRG